MYAGKLPVPPGTSGAEAAQVASDSLRELSWTDLRARLEAARDLRQSLAREAAGDPASFDAPAARHMAALANGKEAGNPSDLANGKGTCSINGVAQDAHLAGL